MVLTIISCIAICILILGTLFSKKQNGQSLSFLLLLFSILAWIIVIYLSNLQFNPSLDLFLNRSVFGFVPLFILGFLLLVRTLEDRPRGIKELALPVTYVLVLLTTSAVSFTQYVTKSITYIPAEVRYDIVPGLFYYPFTIICVCFVLASIYNLYKIQKTTTGLPKSRARILGLSTLVLTGLIIISNILLPRLTESSEFASLAPLWIFLWLLSISYSIFIHRLFDINYALGKVIYLSFLAFLLYIEFYCVFFINRAIFGGSDTAGAFGLGLFLSVLAAIINYIFSNTIAIKLSNVMSYSAFNPENTIRKITQETSRLVNIQEISTVISENLKQTVNPKKSGLIILENTGALVYNSWTNENSPTDFENFPVETILQLVTSPRATPILLEEIIAENSTLIENSPLLDFMKKNSVFVIIPLVHQEQTSGFMLIGEKESKLSYSSQDVEFLENIASIISVSIGRTILFQEVQAFNLTLQEKVESATKELQERNKELEDLYKNLEEIYKKEKDLMDVAGHEFRTPASILKNNLYLLKKRLSEIQKGKSDEKIQKYLDRLVEGTDRQIKLVDTFLESARIDNQRFEIQVEEIDITQMVATAVSEMKPFAQQKSLGIHYSPPQKAIKAEIDKVRIREVVDNLLNNALKYTKKGSIQPKLEETETTVRFSVKDTGIGIKPEDQKLLFKKFSRVDNYIGGEEGSIVRPGGTGLGLFVAKTIIDSHGGTITVESTPEVGSTFTFEIPKTQPSYVKRVQDIKNVIINQDTQTTAIQDLTSTDTKIQSFSAPLSQQAQEIAQIKRVEQINTEAVFDRQPGTPTPSGTVVGAASTNAVLPTTNRTSSSNTPEVDNTPPQVENSSDKNTYQ